MALVIKDRVRESSSTTGTGNIALAGAVGGYRRFSAVMSVSDTCWYAIVLPGSSWETGIGTYSSANTLTRTTVLESSNSDALVNFGAGTKDVFICQPAHNAPFEAGTLMLFQQSTAPVGWTKQTTHNDKALRVVSGTAGSGGTNSFSSVMAQTTVGATTPTINTMASHNHSELYQGANGFTGVQGGGTWSDYYGRGTTNTGSTGGGMAHDHTILMNIQYVDLIIARKD